VSGNRVGAAAASVQKQYGTRGRTVQRNKGSEEWYYEMAEDNPGGSTFTVKNGKIAEISSTYMMC
jgi:hypothetical protein